MLRVEVREPVPLPVRTCDFATETPPISGDQSPPVSCSNPKTPEAASASERDNRTASPSSNEEPPAAWDDEGDWPAIDRLLAQLEASSPSTAFAARAASPHIESPTDRLIRRAASDVAKPRRIRRPRTSWPAWCALSTGLALFACGSVLLGWSFVAGRGDLWSLGMPLSLGGQILLTSGILMQLESLASAQRTLFSTLAEVDQGLEKLTHAATLMTASHSTASQSFYAHMAQGAPSALLLADLKAQLDLLTVKLAEERRT